MKNLTKLMAVLFALSLLAPLAFATSTAGPVDGTAKAKIVAPLVLSHAQGDALDFGTLVSPSAQATVVIPAAASPTPTDTNVERIAADPVSADHFTVTNPESVGYTINLPASATITDGTHNMTVNTFTHSCSASPCTATEFYVGGKLTIGQGQDAGEYEGTYPVSLTY